MTRFRLLVGPCPDDQQSPHDLISAHSEQAGHRGHLWFGRQRRLVLDPETQLPTSLPQVTISTDPISQDAIHIDTTPTDLVPTGSDPDYVPQDDVVIFVDDNTDGQAGGGTSGTGTSTDSQVLDDIIDPVSSEPVDMQKLAQKMQAEMGFSAAATSTSIRLGIGAGAGVTFGLPPLNLKVGYSGET